MQHVIFYLQFVISIVLLRKYGNYHFDMTLTGGRLKGVLWALAASSPFLL